MKKFLALLMACACAFTASAKTSNSLLFSRAQFQPSKASAAGVLLTVPLIYKGTVSAKVDALLALDDADATSVCLSTDKGTLPIFMTMCQPCIDCYPCENLAAQKSATPIDFAHYGTEATIADEKITSWYMYYIVADKKNKTADIYRVDLTAGGNFYTGSDKTAAILTADGARLSGKRSNYTFSYYDAELKKDGANYKWTKKGDKKTTAYIKSASSLTGTKDIYVENVILDDDVYAKIYGTATYKLTRNASLTKQAVATAFSTTTISSGSKGWADCSYDTPAASCEEYFADDVNGYNNFDYYLAAKAYKNYLVDVDTTQASVAQAVADLFDMEKAPTPKPEPTPEPTPEPAPQQD